MWLYRHKSLEAEYEAAVGQPESWDGWDLVWDRKVEGGFPEMKALVSLATASTELPSRYCSTHKL